MKMYYKREGEYLTITRDSLPTFFEIRENKVYIKNSKSLPFTLCFPLILDENIARIAAMILDGSISKDLCNFMFSQKKDLGKPIEFSAIIKMLFGVNGHFSIHKASGTTVVTFSRKTLASFLYYCLGIHKSNEDARIPSWISISPKKIIREYLRYAFAMEGSISLYSKGVEIKFHSVSLSYVSELKLILKKEFCVDSTIQEYYIKDYGWKYYLYISSQESAKKFSRIGFALYSHQKRLETLISSFKNKAWEITLIKIFDLRQNYFTLRTINSRFIYLSKRAVHQRLVILTEKQYLIKQKIGYYLTAKGKKTAIKLKRYVKITPLRTNAKDNERRILFYLNKNNSSYRNEISRNLNLNAKTVGDTLQRLLKKGRIKCVGTDRFQRMYYTPISV